MNKYEVETKKSNKILYDIFTCKMKNTFLLVMNFKYFMDATLVRSFQFVINSNIVKLHLCSLFTQNPLGLNL